MRTRILSLFLFGVVALFASVPVAEACDENSDPSCTIDMGEGGALAARRASSMSTDLWCEGRLGTSYWAHHWLTVTLFDPNDNVLDTEHKEGYPRHITTITVSATVEPGTYPCTAEYAVESLFHSLTVFWIVDSSFTSGKSGQSAGRKPRLVRMNEVFPTIRDGWTSSWRAALSQDPSWTHVADAFGRDGGTTPARVVQRTSAAPIRKAPLARGPSSITWRREHEL
jgi:hypothetical protein